MLSPKASMWINIVIALLGFLTGAGASAFPGYVPHMAAVYIVQTAGFALGAIAALNGVLHAYSSPFQGPMVAAPQGVVAQAVSGSGAAPVVKALLLFAFVGLMALAAGQARAQQADFLKLLAPLTKWVATDYDDALKATAAYPDRPDQMLAACLPDFKPVVDILRDHPLIFTLHPLTDLAYARQVVANFHDACQNPACSQVFQDAQNALKLPFQFTSICHLVPIVSMAYSAPAAASKAAPAAAAGAPK